MEKHASDVYVYDLVQYDRASGRRAVMSAREPIVGRDPAHKELEKLRRANRDPNVYYAVERSTRREYSLPETPQDLLKHDFQTA